jgi:SpoVK/Ycf46/Vps4 family AAA+-type ATPase
VVASAAVQVAPQGQAAARAARLRDQHGRLGGFEPAARQTTVVFVVSAARLKRLREWEASLRKRFEGLRFVRVADVPPSRPPARYEDVAKRLRQHVPPEVSVLVDVDRVWATGFGLDSRQVNLLVFDGTGHLAGQLAGGATPERFAQAVALVEPPAPGPAR